ncbi:hypothetical protein OG871_03350 [Kitasatospora sp. NBC_00374]|uniref:hypothetical protein n=1 Tax=Kitasatospora sp. NBC_00374 TaxID=2975964 RepID=UPI0030E52440
MTLRDLPIALVPAPRSPEPPAGEPTTAVRRRPATTAPRHGGVALVRASRRRVRTGSAGLVRLARLGRFVEGAGVHLPRGAQRLGPEG